jgi:polar amino acid transport system substrate-binding protein
MANKLGMANKWGKFLGTIILTIIISIISVKMLVPNAQILSKTSSVYDRVLKAGTIRACYVVYPPASIKDPNTGEMSGVFVETLNKAAENMGLKVDWNAEVGWGEMIEALNSDRCDIIGSPAWSNSTRGRSAEFANPVYYSAINAYVRANDNRFDNNLQIANDKKYKLATVDGETSQVIASRQFPNAQTLQLPQSTDVSLMLTNVADGKADMAFLEPTVANAYIKNNPGKIKNISVNKPVVVYGNVMMIKKGELTFKTTIDNALNELLNNGFVDESINKYEAAYPGGFYRAAPAYIVPGSR